MRADDTGSCPLRSLVAGIDPLSAFFMIPLLILAASCSLYGPRYFAGHPAGRSHWFFFSLLVSGMVMVLLARNAVLFILAWEIMSLSSFFLVITDKKNPEAMRAGWIYFVTAHVGTAFLLVLFFLLAASTGSFDFAAWTRLHLAAAGRTLLFVLALVAFGLKAGFIPFHVWLPLAHPSAPSHVSALMSGIMIKMGIYGLLRILTFFTPFHAWWGMLLIALGAVSGILGVLFALGQHDIKRLLAYHSVENIGIILLGIGIGMTGVAFGSSDHRPFRFRRRAAACRQPCALQRTAVSRGRRGDPANGSGEIDRLGGLIKKMPRTAVFFLVGSVAICGLPFFNGFISELFIYVAGISGAVHAPSPALSLAGLVVIVCAGAHRRSGRRLFHESVRHRLSGRAAQRENGTRRSEVPAAMLWSMGLLAALCLVIGMGSPSFSRSFCGPPLLFAGPAAEPSTRSVVSLDLDRQRHPGSSRSRWPRLRRRWSSADPEEATGHVEGRHLGLRLQPARPVDAVHRLFLCRPHRQAFPASPARARAAFADGKLFPGEDLVVSFRRGGLVPDQALFAGGRSFDRLFASLRWFQSGKTGQYVFYIAITVFCLIIWKFFL